LSYTADEVRALIEHWESFRYSDRIWIRVRYADLTVAYDKLPTDLRATVLLHGLLRTPVREAGASLGVSKSTVARRYDEAIEWMANYLSGSDY